MLLSAMTLPWSVLLFLMTRSPCAPSNWVYLAISSTSAQSVLMVLPNVVLWLLHCLLLSGGLIGVVMVVAPFWYLTNRWRSCRRDSWRFAYGALYCLLVGIIPVGMGFPELLWDGPIALQVIGYTAISVSFGLVFVVHGRISAAKLLQIGRTCAGCGYCLEHLRVPRCPECGATAAICVAAGAHGRRYPVIAAMVVGLTVGIYVVYPTVLVPLYMHFGDPNPHVSVYRSVPTLAYMLDLNPWRSNQVIASYLDSSDVQLQRRAADWQWYRLYFACGNPSCFQARTNSSAGSGDYSLRISPSLDIVERLRRVVEMVPDPLVKTNAIESIRVFEARRSR